MNEPTRWSLILLATMAIWATFHPIGKILLADVSPLTLSFFRVFFALFFFIPYLAHQKQLSLPAKEDRPYIAGNASVGIFLAMGLNATGLSLSTASASAVLIDGCRRMENHRNPHAVALGGFDMDRRHGLRRVLEPFL